MTTPSPSISLRQNGRVVVAVAGLATAYALGALWLPVATILVLGSVWIWGQRAGWSWLGWLMLVLVSLTAGVGAWLDLTPLPLVVGFVAALSAWDLDTFARRLRRVDAVEHEERVKRRHLRRLVVVDGLGLALALLALNVQIRLSFGAALGLGLIALLALGRALGFLGRESG